MKALEKDRNRRYETATSFAADIQHYLNDEAVEACPPSAAYKFRKFARRNKVAFGTTAAVVLALVAGICGTAWQAVRATTAEREALDERDRAVTAEELAETRLENVQEQRRRAEQAEELAEERFQLAEQRYQIAKEAVDEYLAKVTENEQLKNANFQELRRELLEAAKNFYERLADEKPNDEDQAYSRAWALFKLGIIHNELGERRSARENFEQAVFVAEERAAALSGVSRYDILVAYAKDELGMAFQDLGQYEKARELYTEALEIRRRAVTEAPERRHDVAISLGDLGTLCIHLGESAQALSFYEQAIDVFQSLVSEHPEDRDSRSRLSTCHNNLGVLQRDLGQIDEARGSHEQALELRRQLVSEFPDVPLYRNLLAASHHNLGILFYYSERFEEACNHYGEAVALREQLVSQFPNLPEYQKDLASTHTMLGGALIVLERRADARIHLERALEIGQRVAGEMAETPEYRNSEALSHYYMGMLLEEEDRTVDARQHWEQGLEIQQALVSEFPAVPHYRFVLASLHLKLGWLMKASGEREGAVEQHELALSILEQLVSDCPEVPHHRSSLAECYSRLAGINQTDDLNGLYDKAVELAPESYAVNYNFGIAFYRKGMLNKAAACLQAAIDINPQSAKAHVMLGCTRGNQGMLDEAIASFQTAIELDPNHPEAHRNLARAYSAKGQFGESASHYRNEFEADRRIHGLNAPTTLNALNYFFAASEAANAHAEAISVWEELRGEVERNGADDQVPDDASADYRIRIEQPGEYQLYLRWGGESGETDSMYAGLLDENDEVIDWYLFQGASPRPDIGDADADFETHAWETFGARRRRTVGDPAYKPEQTVLEQPALFTVPVSGDYTLRLLRRDAGAAADALVLQQSHLPAPGQEGPSASTRDETGGFVVGNGTVTIEAENFSSASPSCKVITRDAAAQPRHRNFRGSGYLQFQ